MTIGFALLLMAGGILGFVNPDEVGRDTGIPLPVLGAFLWAVGIYLIVGSARELQRRNRGQ